MLRRGFYNPFVWCRGVFVLAFKRLPIKAMVIITIVGLLVSGNLFSNSSRPQQAVASSSQSTWWSNNYIYRQQITITAGTDALASGFVVKTSIDTSALQTASKVRSDRKDWRILYYNTGASSWNEIARDATLTSATYFALQADISASASDSNYYAYYGYSAESSSPSSYTQNLGVKLNGNPFNTTDAVSTDYVSVADNASLRLTTGMTIEAWVNISANSSEVIACKGATAGDPDYLFSTYTDNSLGLYDGTAWRQSNTSVLTNNTWTHVAVTFDGSIYRFFRNGVAIGTSSYTGSIQTSTSELNIGRQCAATNPYHGLIDDVRIWNTARAEADILANYTNELVGNESGLVSEWKFNNGTGTSATDATSNGFTGTLQNATSWLPARQAVAIAPTVADGSRQEVSTYSLYFNGRSLLTSYKLGQASSADGGVSFTKSGSNPVLAAVASTWESTWVKDPWAIRVGDAIYLYYAGYDGTTHQIGVARSTDGVNFVKHTSNPIVAVGAGGTWDSNGTLFPTVFFDKDESDPTKVYKMFYTGKNGSGTQQIGLAFSADGINWTKYASNPVVAVGAGGTWDDTNVTISSNPIKVGDTYTMLYNGIADTDGAAAYAKWSIGSVSFTSFTGTYTKNAGNPVMTGRSTAVQTLTGQTNSGTTTVTVGDTSVFVANESVLVRDGSNNDEFNRVASIDSATQLTLSTATARVYPIGSTIRSWMVGSVAPRTLEYISSAWKMWWTAFQPHNDLLRETSGYATSIDGASWTVDYANSPTIPFSDNENDWDGHSSENTAVIVPTQQLGTSPMSSPSGFSGSPAATAVTWSWSNNSALESGYKVYDEAANLKNTAAVNATSWEETGLSVNTQYIRHVHGYSDYGNSDPSNEYRVYTLANAPGTPTVDTPTSTSLKVTLAVNSNPAATEFAINETTTGNYVQANGTLGASPVWQSYATWGGASGQVVSGLSNNTIYTFKAKARNGDNTETAYSSTANGSTDSTAPTTPGTPSATTPTTDTTPTWTWTASTDTGGLATPAYSVQWSTDSSFNTGVSSSTSTTNSFTHSSALAENTWYFRVLATDLSANASPYSSNGTVVVDTTAPSATGTPSTSSPTNSTSVNWTWTAATDALSGVANYIWRVTDSLDSAYSNSTTVLTNVTTTLIEGLFNFYVKAIDVAGNIGAELTAQVTVDLSGPTTPSISSPTEGTVTADTTPPFSSSAFSDTLTTHTASQWLIDNNADFSSLTIDSGDDTTNKTSYTVATPLTDTTYYAKVRYKDSAGNYSLYSTAISFTVDTTAPSAPVVSTPASATNVNAANYAVTGTAEANALVTVYTDPNNDGSQADGASAGTQQLTGGATSYSISVTLSQDATNYFVVTAKDSLANESTPTDVPTITEDSTAPTTPSISSPTNGSTTADNTPAFTSSAFSDTASTHAYSQWLIDNNSDFSSLTIDSGDDATNKISYTATTLTDTTYYAKVRYKDSAGNYSLYSSSISFTVDTTAPSAPVVSDPGASTTLNSASYSVVGTAEANALVTVYTDPNNDGSQADGASAGTEQLTGGATSYSVSVTLTQNSANNFVVTAKDSVANESTPANIPTLTEDSAGPTTPSISSPTTDSRANDTTPAFASSAFSDTYSSHSASQWLIDNTSNLFPSPEVDTGDDSTNKVSYTPSALSEGTHYAKVRYKDSTGNYSSFSSVITFTVDITAPSAPTSVSVAKADSLGGLTITWTDPVAADLSTVDIYRSTASGTEGSLVANVAGGLGTYSDSSLSDNTTYYYTLKATDSASNTSNATTQANQTTHTVATKLVISDVSAQSAGTAFSITVTATDANANQSLLATNSVAITATDSQATLPADSSLVAGTKDYSVTLKTAGSITLTATASGLTVGTATVTVSAGSVSANTSSLVGASATGTVGTAVTLTGTVKDAYSNALSGQTVVLSSSRSSDTLTQPTSTTNSSGVATGTVNATIAGVSTLTATVGSTTIGTHEVTFSAVASSDADADADADTGTDTETGSSDSSSSDSSSSSSDSSSSSSSTDSASSSSSVSTPSTSLGAGSSSSTDEAVVTTIELAKDTEAPKPAISAPKFAYVGQAITLDGSGSTDNIAVTSYTWAFPDGSFSTQKSPTYILPSVGEQTIKLTVEDKAGNKDSLNHIIVVVYQKPTDTTATQTGNTITVTGKTEPYATVIVYVFSDPKSFNTTADGNGDYEIKIMVSQIGEGDHHFATVSMLTASATTENIALIQDSVVTQRVARNDAISDEPLTKEEKATDNAVDIQNLTVTQSKSLWVTDKRLLAGIGLLVLALALVKVKNKKFAKHKSKN